VTHRTRDRKTSKSMLACNVALSSWARIICMGATRGGAKGQVKVKKKDKISDSFDIFVVQ